MVVIYPPDMNGVEKKVEKEIERLKKLRWYQTGWSILIIGIIASAIVALIFYFL